MNTVNTDVISYVQSIGCGKFGEDLYFGRVPNSEKTPTDLWWIVPMSTSIRQHNASGEDVIQYQYELNFRSLSVKTVNDKLFAASREIVGSHCYELNHFQTMDIKLVSVNQMTMKDSENRIVGSITFTVTVYNILEQKVQPDEGNNP